MIVLAALATAAAWWLAAPPPATLARWRLAATPAQPVLPDLRWRRRARIRDGETRVVEILELVAAELRAGIEPHRAAHHVAQEFTELAPWASALTDPAGAAAEIAVAATQPGRGRLVDLDAAWHLAHRTGAPLAVVVDRVAAEVRDELELAREVGRQIAPARSTARIMAVLPLFGLAIGAGTGANPWQTVTAHPLAVVSVVLGVALAALGVWWIERIVRSVEDP